MLKLTLLALCFCIPTYLRAEDAAIEQLFLNAGVDGTIVTESLSTGQRFVHNDTWLFALNLVTRDTKDLPLRIQIAKDALKVKGVLKR